MLERFLASLSGKCVVLCLVLVLLLGFGFHIAYNLRRAGAGAHPPGEIAHPSSDPVGSPKPQP